MLKARASLAARTPLSLNARRHCTCRTSLQVRRTFCTATPPFPSYIVVAADVAALQTSPAKRSHNVSRPALGWIVQNSIVAVALEASIDAAWHQRRQQNKEPHLRDAHLPCKKDGKKEERASAIPSVNPSQFPKILVEKKAIISMIVALRPLALGFTQASGSVAAGMHTPWSAAIP